MTQESPAIGAERNMAHQVRMSKRAADLAPLLPRGDRRDRLQVARSAHPAKTRPTRLVVMNQRRSQGSPRGEIQVVPPHRKR